MTLMPGLEAAVAGTVSDGAITFVLSAMVLRVLRNPNGVRSWSVDDYSETRDNALSAGSLYASPDEMRCCGWASGRSGAFSVVPAAGVGAPGSESERRRTCELVTYGTLRRCQPGSLPVTDALNLVWPALAPSR
jgi:hypothetical protein